MFVEALDKAPFFSQVYLLHLCTTSSSLKPVSARNISSKRRSLRNTRSLLLRQEIHRAIPKQHLKSVPSTLYLLAVVACSGEKPLANVNAIARYVIVK